MREIRTSGSMRGRPVVSFGHRGSLYSTQFLNWSTAPTLSSRQTRPMNRLPGPLTSWLSSTATSETRTQSNNFTSNRPRRSKTTPDVSFASVFCLPAASSAPPRAFRLVVTIFGFTLYEYQHAQSQ